MEAGFEKYEAHFRRKAEAGFCSFWGRREIVQCQGQTPLPAFLLIEVYFAIIHKIVGDCPPGFSPLSLGGRGRG